MADEEADAILEEKEATDEVEAILCHRLR